MGLREMPPRRHRQQSNGHLGYSSYRYGLPFRRVPRFPPWRVFSLTLLSRRKEADPFSAQPDGRVKTSGSINDTLEVDPKLFVEEGPDQGAFHSTFFPDPPPVR
jgi:hypothetical protein